MYSSTWNFLVTGNISLPQHRMASTKNLSTVLHFTNKNVSESSAVILSNTQEAPDSREINQILEWQSVNIGFICKSEGPSRPQTSKQQANQIREALAQSSNKLIPTAYTDLGIPKTIIQNIMDKRFCFKPYRLQMLQTISEENKVRRANFSQHIITWMQDGKMDMYVFCNRIMLDLCRTIKNRMYMFRVARILLNVKAFLHEQLVGSWTGCGRTIPW